MYIMKEKIPGNFQKGISEKNADQYVGYRVYNTSGKKVYVSVKLPYRVQVKTGSIPVRKGPAKTCRSMKQIRRVLLRLPRKKMDLISASLLQSENVWEE